jgi:hypothetical protein
MRTLSANICGTDLAPFTIVVIFSLNASSLRVSTSENFIFFFFNNDFAFMQNGQ